MGSCLGRRESTPARTEGRGPPHPSSSTTGERTGLLATFKSNSNFNGEKATVSTSSGSSGGASATRSGRPSLTDHSDQFTYLEKTYSMETPSCLVPHINELYKSICERYDIAVTNREKVDEALQLFKKVLEVDIHLPITECFVTWKSSLTQPKFTIARDEKTGDVKKISVRAEEVPRLKRKAQKHIRDLLDACHLYLQQKEFLKKEIRSGLEELEDVMRDIPGICKGVNLSSTERKNMPKIVKRARDQFIQFPDTLDQFSSQITALIREINDAVHTLVDD